MIRWKFDKNLHWGESKKDWPRYICNDLYHMSQQVYYGGPSYPVHLPQSTQTIFIGSIHTFEEFLELIESEAEYAQIRFGVNE